ncbi:MAG: methylmalonyl-CoA mutase, partial [Candidatus Eremiobacteraeota bacterium]|nr:methylmalonyl-CoA mutase [Candidatus Eremiobacteraeota bacterium]
EALAAVCGGAQSLHTNGYDEALAIPSEAAMKIALRTQQIIAEESGVAGTIDPLGGSWAVEKLTADIERDVLAYFAEIDRRGGVVRCIEENYFQAEIADASFEFHKRKEKGEFEFVGVTKYRDDSANPAVELHHIDEAASQRQLDRLARVKTTRDKKKVDAALAELVGVAKTDENLMPPTIEAVRARVTGGEIVNALRPIFGTYVEKPIF